ncbi:bacteriohemerythrin [Rubidibacter lacunae]|nr:bacteriohemerythrin [Rubidibacter lacunae]
MSIAPWSDEYCTDHHVIDTQHQTLFELVNRIHDAIIAGESHCSAVRAMLADFEVLAQEHFELEEELMRTYQYPNYEVHFGMHRRLCRKVRSALEKYDRDTDAFSHDVPQVLADWMIHHIRGEDRQTIAFLQSRIKAPATTLKA